jgi:hypothetical protein
MVTTPNGLRPEEDYAREDQQHIQKTDLSSRQRGRLTKQDCNCQRVINMELDTKTYWVTDRQSQCDFDFGLECVVQWDCYNYCVKIRHQERLLKTEKTLCVLQLQWYLECVIQWGCCNYCVKIRYQEASTEDGEDLMCAAVTVIFGVRNSVSCLITVLKSVTRKRLLKTEKTLCVLHLQWYLECVIQWGYCNYCVKFITRKRLLKYRRLYVYWTYNDIWRV